MNRELILLVLLSTLVTSGCVLEGEKPVDKTSEAPPASDGFVDPGWPRPSEAEIRPGVMVGNMSCTSGFLFRSPDNTTLYLSAAGHCFREKDAGDSVAIRKGKYSGRLAYAINAANSLVEKDFALIALNNSYRDEVHPAVYHYGGPTGISKNVSRGDRVVTFGNSSLREPIDSSGDGEPPASPGNTLDPRGGIVYNDSKYETQAYFAPPSIHGDSGSPVMTDEGQAVGVVTTGHIGGCGVCNGIANLDANLALAREEGITVSLVTWPMFNSDWPTPPSIPGSNLPAEGREAGAAWPSSPSHR